MVFPDIWGWSFFLSPNLESFSALFEIINIENYKTFDFFFLSFINIKGKISSLGEFQKFSHPCI